MLSVHLYRQSQHTAAIAQEKRTVTVNKKNEQQTHQGPQEFKREGKSSGEEEVTMIPLEDVTLISSKSESKQGFQADVKSHTTPYYEYSENCCDRCCAGLLKCCRKTRDCCCSCCQKETKVDPLVRNTTTIFSDEDPNHSTHFEEEHVPFLEVKEGYCTPCCNIFRCWCCRTKKLVDLIKRTDTKANRRAQRVITITVEYSKYSNLDSATNARLLSNEQQVAYYKEKFQPDTKLKFYLINDTEYDASNFEVKRQQAEVLCKAVMQLKGMRNHYPSETELEKILDQPIKRTFGAVYAESTLQLPFDSSSRTTGREDSQIQQLPQSSQPRAIPQQRPTTPKYHDETETKVVEQDINKQDDDS
jgi:hypothetical protein